jgi:hypothetical protein
LQFALINAHPAKRQVQMRMYSYIQDEIILKRLMDSNSVSAKKITPPALDIYTSCNELKKIILQANAGVDELPTDFEKQNIILEEGSLGNTFIPNGRGTNLIKQLQEKIVAFNSNVDEKQKLPVKNTILDADFERLYSYSNYLALSNLSQVQMILLME